jgi:tetratricopeptide (TPR) repeat protein
MMSKVRLGKMTEAVERLAYLELPGACPWPGYDTWGADAYHPLGRFEDELELIRGGLTEYPQRLGFLYVEARALVGLGRIEAVDSLIRVITAAPGTGERRWRALTVAGELRAHGHADPARRVADEVLASFGDDLPMGGAAEYALALADRWDEALVMLVAEEVEDPELANVVGFLSEYGVVLAHEGRREDAHAQIARIETGTGLARNKYYNQARVAAALGDRDEAVRFLTLAFQNGFWHPADAHSDYAFDAMWGYGPFDALMLPK